MEKDLIEIKIGQDLPSDKRRMSIWVKKEDINTFDSIHRTAVQYESEKQAKELAKKYLSDWVFNLLNIK